MSESSGCGVVFRLIDNCFVIKEEIETTLPTPLPPAIKILSQNTPPGDFKEKFLDLSPVRPYLFVFQIRKLSFRLSYSFHITLRNGSLYISTIKYLLSNKTKYIHIFKSITQSWIDNYVHLSHTYQERNKLISTCSHRCIILVNNYGIHNVALNSFKTVFKKCFFIDLL